MASHDMWWAAAMLFSVWPARTVTHSSVLRMAGRSGLGRGVSRRLAMLPQLATDLRGGRGREGDARRYAEAGDRGGRN